MPVCKIANCPPSFCSLVAFWLLLRRESFEYTALLEVWFPGGILSFPLILVRVPCLVRALSFAEHRPVPAGSALKKRPVLLLWWSWVLVYLGTPSDNSYCFAECSVSFYLLYQESHTKQLILCLTKISFRILLQGRLYLLQDSLPSRLDIDTRSSLDKASIDTASSFLRLSETEVGVELPELREPSCPLIVR